MLPFAYVLYGESFYFMRDGASIHTARIFHEWFRALDVTVLPWAAKSPDLNPMENVCGVLARSVCRDGKQYSTVEELKDALVECWNNIGQSFLDR